MVKRGVIGVVALAVCAALTVGHPLTGEAAYEEIAVKDGGSVTGVVRFTGTAPKAEPIAVNKNRDVCGDQKPSEALIVGADKGVKGSVVLLEGIKQGKKATPGLLARGGVPTVRKRTRGKRNIVGERVGRHVGFFDWRRVRTVGLSAAHTIAGAHAGGPQPFALHQGFQNAALRQPRQAVSAGREFLQQLLLGLRLQAWQNGIGREQIGDVHQESR